MTPSFSDEDLQRFKDYYEDPKRGDTPLKWTALLHRIECAEAFIFDPVEDMDECQFCGSISDDDNKVVHEEECELNNSYKAWLAAKGIGK